MKQGESGDVAPNILLEKFGLWFSAKLGARGRQRRVGREASYVQQLLWNRQPAGRAVSGNVLFAKAWLSMVRQFDAADRLCPACAGMGRVDLMDGSGAVTCPRCEGRGMIQSQAAAAAEQE